jgi:hypothetical protein
MRPVAEWEEGDLLQLIRDAVQESVTLDYKASPALAKTDAKKSDISKDASAFANSEGGILVYGMVENRHVPTNIDNGSDRNVITKEWLESVIKTNIHPTIDGVLIRQIDLPSKGPDKVAYAIEIPQATSRAPHQANDYRYYNRSNFESKPMQDYEVRDLMRRSIEYGKKYAAAWDLDLEIQRLQSSVQLRSEITGDDWLPRSQLAVSISAGLRGGGLRSPCCQSQFAMT